MSEQSTIAPSHDSLDCTVIVPAYNERESLGQLVREIVTAFDALDKSFEILVVDDGSRDGTWEELEALAHDIDQLRAVRLRRNFGKSTALATGISNARGGTIITMDGDLQDDPAEIHRFLEAIDGKDRLVTGWKADRKDPLSKRLPSKVFNAVTSAVSGVRVHDHNCGFKAAPASCYRSIPMYGELHRFVPAMAHDLGYEVVEIKVNHRPRIYGKSKFGIERFVRGLLDLITVMMITRYRRRPGHFLGGLGVILGVIGFGILAYLTILWFVDDDPIGTRPLLMLGVLLMMVSVQLFSFGIIAELVVNRAERRDHPELAVAGIRLGR